MAPFRIDLRRKVVALGGTALLVCGAIVGHPGMTVADGCVGWHDMGCQSLEECRSYCQQTFGGVCDGDACGMTAGVCHCDLYP